MPLGDRTDYNEPEHDKQLREIGSGVSRPPPAPPELVEALLGAERILMGRPVRALEDDHTYPRWKVYDDMGMELGFGSVSLSNFRTSTAIQADRVADLRERAERCARRDQEDAPTRRRRLRVGTRVSAFYWAWRCPIPATVVEVRDDVVVVDYYDGDRGEVSADLVRSLERAESYSRGDRVSAFYGPDQCYYPAVVASSRLDDGRYKVDYVGESYSDVLPPQLLRAAPRPPPPPRRPSPAPPPPRRRPPPRRTAPVAC